jgi:hypothetical protein
MEIKPYKYAIVFSFLFVVPITTLVLFNRYFADYDGRTGLILFAELVGASGLAALTGNSRRMPRPLKAGVITFLSVAIWLLILGIYLVFNFNPRIG